MDSVSIVVSVDDEGKNATLANRILNTANGGKYFVMMSSFFKVIVVSCFEFKIEMSWVYAASTGYSPDPSLSPSTRKVWKPN